MNLYQSIVLNDVTRGTKKYKRNAPLRFSFQPSKSPILTFLPSNRQLTQSKSHQSNRYCKMGRPAGPLSAHLPPLVMGTATFNTQFNPDPYALPTTELVHRALASGVSAFDTSPYYGPAEELLGRALATDYVRANHPRESYRILTKVGREHASSFDYSPEWVRVSIKRSLQRLHTEYLDLVYCHDVEFVSPAEVLQAVRELRRIRDEEGTIRYVGISGYPIDVLCELAEMVLRETGEPLDAVMSYAHFTLQNTSLLTRALPRLLEAGVDVVPNASPLGMGLLRRQGVPIGSQGDFHPSPAGLRGAIQKAAEWADSQGERIEVVAIRYALERWLREATEAGASGPPPLVPSAGIEKVSSNRENKPVHGRLGVSVMGVSNVGELNETLRVWHSILDGLDTAPASASDDANWSRTRRQQILTIAQGIQSILGSEWVDYAWESPGPGFVNSLPESHLEAKAKAGSG